MERISPEEVRAEVSRFWNVFSSKSKEKFDEMYFPAATVFSSTARHTEPGRLMVARRLRQFFGPVVELTNLAPEPLPCEPHSLNKKSVLLEVERGVPPHRGRQQPSFRKP